MRPLELTSYRTPDTQRTQDYWRQLFPNQVPRRKPQKQEAYSKTTDTIFLECGCPATMIVYRNGSTITFPHHIQGCEGEKD